MADGIRKIASALYERVGQEEKREAIDYFDALDSDKDRKVSLGEFQNGYDGIVESQLSNDGVFKELSSNADGTLSFEDVLVIFYSKKGMIEILPCDECEELIFGPSFSSASQNSRHTICCRCYNRGVSIHPRRSRSTPTPAPANNLTLVNYTDPTLSTRKEEMRNLSEIAKSHYKAASPEVKSMAEEFFESMDGDGDGRVEIEEFLSFVRAQGYGHMHNNQFFKELDVDGNGSLGFWEVMTLYYIIKSGRPFCGRCGDFVPGIYFSCVVCIEDRNNRFDICYGCYESDKCKHSHNGDRALFLDNYTMLQTKHDSESANVDFKNERRNINKVNEQSAIIVARDHQRQNKDHYSLQLVPRLRIATAAFKVLDAALAVAEISATACTIL